MVSRAYRQYSYTLISSFAGEVNTGLRKSPSMFDPLLLPVKDTEMDILIANQISKYAEYHHGGDFQKPAFEAAQGALIVGLDKNAVFVEGVAKGNATNINASGYKATEAGYTPRPGPEEQPVVEVKKGKQSGEIITETAALVPGNYQYGCIISEGKPLESDVIITSDGNLMLSPKQTNQVIISLTSQRVKTIKGLTPKVDYWVYYFIVNANGVSILSKGVMISCA